MNKGAYPPEFNQEQERYIEDVNKRTRSDDQFRKVMMKLIKLVAEERTCLDKQALKYKVSKTLDELRKSGKPFYWVDHKRL